MLEFIGDNSNQITIIFAIGAGVFAFLRWLDARNQKLKNERYEQYTRHIRILAGSKENKDVRISLTEQIAAVWFLLEYPEYYHITLKILDNSDLEKMSNEPWQGFVLPQVKKVIEEIKSRS